MKSPKDGQRHTEPSSSALSISSPEQLQWEAQQVQLGITRRAYELFLARGNEHGHDWEDWFQAEAELLRPVPVVQSESAGHITLCANVLGFEPGELRVAVEPSRITILGNKGERRADAYPDQILRHVSLATEIVPQRATVWLKTGVLRFELPKAVPRVSKAPAA